MLLDMFTMELKKSNNQDLIQGKLILNLSTRINSPVHNMSSIQDHIDSYTSTSDGNRAIQESDLPEG